MFQGRTAERGRGKREVAGKKNCSKRKIKARKKKR